MTKQMIYMLPLRVNFPFIMPDRITPAIDYYGEVIDDYSVWNKQREEYIDNLYNALAKIPDGNNEISFIIRKQNGSKIEVKTQYSKNMSFENRTIISQIKGVSFYNLAQ